MARHWAMAMAMVLGMMATFGSALGGMISLQHLLDRSRPPPALEHRDALERSFGAPRP
jgi:hypothetical protein